MNDTAPRLISRAAFARQLGMSVRTLENWEARDYGPRPLRLGRSVRYSAAEVEGFIYHLANADLTQAAS